ncbi:radical SAM/SPASM domain-containing protein [Novosphingobium malaysiense]|uniref:Radical SAM core domain-containing protein n=1 Tax=Novosphingobium malaysiense TaxID=1348853 RepID=A0A0B1ZHW0_9SPHN|nr:radical SAM protein [Novosphingobium malaysiense]KHK90662.1 hypothetical protein LK12_15150 [Novosphingobium malaysiense]
MRFSSYSILSEKKEGIPRTLLNGITGAVDLLGPQLEPVIENALETGDVPAALAHMSDEARQSLLNRGHLTEWSVDEERAIVNILADEAHKAMARRPSFMIVPNLDCNYRCTYCFERPMQNGLKSSNTAISHKKNNVVMQAEQVGQALDAIALLRAEQGLSEEGQIILYGGEPLDRRNQAVVRQIVSEGRARGTFFAAITNGHDLDAYLDLIGRGGIEQIQVSIDGPKRVHDKRRIYVGKESSFDAIVANVNRVLEHTDAEVQIRSHVDPQNIELFGELVDFFAGQGWLDHPQVVIYGNTVYERTGDGGVTSRIDVADIDATLSPIAQAARNIYTSAPEVHAERSILPALNAGEPMKLKGTYCSANTGNYIFAPDGSIYACWESVGKECSRIGTFGESGAELDAEATDRWFGRSIARLPTCQRCAFALVCGGGCAQYAEYESDTLYASYCDDFQRTFRSALTRTVERYLDHDCKQEEKVDA